MWRASPSSAFQEADIVSSKDSGHGDSEQGDSDHDATNRGHSAGELRLAQFLTSVFKHTHFPSPNLSPRRVCDHEKDNAELLVRIGDL